MIADSLHRGKICNSEFRADIQGLRAVAVLGVILFHANKDWLPGGFVGVDIFFVISGFLIANIVLEKKSKSQFRFAEFYLGRARRIFPAYFVMLAFVTFAAAILFTPQDFPDYWQSAKYAILFWSNNYYSGFGNYFSPSSHELPLLHTWSLAIEMQFYLLLPAIIIFFPVKKLHPVLLTLMIALMAYGISLIAMGDKKVAYFSLLVRVPEFLVGVLVASINRRQEWMAHSLFKSSIAFAGLALIFLAFIIINEDSNFPGAYILLPCLGAAFLIIGQGGIVSRFLSARPFVWIGGISYSLYLWHWPIFAFARYVKEDYELKFSLLLALLPIILILSYGSLRLIEAPCRSRNWLKGKGLARTLFLSLGVLVPIISAQKVNAAVEVPLAIEYSRYAHPSLICHGKLVGECLRGRLDGRDTHPVLVLGDSHAAQLNLFFDQISKMTGETYRIISASNCVTIPDFDVQRIPEYAQKDCLASISLARRFIPDAHQLIIAAMWQYHWQSHSFTQAFRNLLSASQAAGIPVKVLWQVPMLTSNVQRHRRFEHLGFKSEIKLDSQWMAANKHIAEIVADYHNAQFLQLDQSELFSEAPYFGEELLYSDSHHLNEVGAKVYADHVAAWFMK